MRQWAGRQIKQSPSRSPINTSHSLASLQTPPPQPLRSSCEPTEPSCVQHVQEEDTVSHLKRNIFSHFTSPAVCYLSSHSPATPPRFKQNCSVCFSRHAVDVSGALVFFTYTSDVPSGTRWLKLLLKEARRWPAKNERRKKREARERERGGKIHV